MDKYLKAEKRLAELLGWKQHPEYKDVWLNPLQNHYASPPRYCRDWNACGPLMVEHIVAWTVGKTYDNKWHETIEAKCQYAGVDDTEEVIVADHPDKDTAVRYAIVMAVIAKLGG